MSANQASAFQVHALGSYTGPGAVTVQVYDGATMQDPHGAMATLTIPAQVGPDAPILRCPQDPLPVVEGGAPLNYDIGQLCHVWVDTTVAPPALATARLGQGARRGQRQRVRRHQPQLTAASSAAPGATGTLRITPAGARPAPRAPAAAQRRGDQGAAADRPGGRVTVEAGHSVTVNLASTSRARSPPPESRCSASPTGRARP